jgi:deoxyribose-phosphate aldolase
MALASDFEKLCAEAIEHSFFSVCVPPNMVAICAKILRNTPVKVCTVIGFPLGYNTTPAKAFEAKLAYENGAQEFDMVISLAALKGQNHNLVVDDIGSVLRAGSGKTTKVIIETCYLTEEEKVLACELAMRAGAHFVKTSTGFGPSGANELDIRLMAKTVGGRLGVKASGGIRDYTTAMKMIDAGATRIGTSNGIAIVNNSSSSEDKSY